MDPEGAGGPIGTRHRTNGDLLSCWSADPDLSHRHMDGPLGVCPTEVVGHICMEMLNQATGTLSGVCQQDLRVQVHGRGLHFSARRPPDTGRRGSCRSRWTLRLSEGGHSAWSLRACVKSSCGKLRLSSAIVALSGVPQALLDLYV